MNESAELNTIADMLEADGDEWNLCASLRRIASADQCRALPEVKLPELVGTLAALPSHTQATIKAYGKACASAAWVAAKAAEGEPSE